MKQILILIAGLGLLCSCSSTFEYKFGPQQYTTAAQNSAKEAKKKIEAAPNKIQASGIVLLAPIVQAFEYDMVGPNNDTDFYTWWRSGSDSAALSELQRGIYTKSFNRLAKSFKVAAPSTNMASLGSKPVNPADQTFKFRPSVISSPDYELNQSNTDAIKAATGASIVIYVALHSIWIRDGYVALFQNNTVNFQVNQWLVVYVCTSSTNCIKTTVPQNNSRYSVWVPVPLYENKQDFLIEGDKFATELYTNNVSEVIEAAVLSLLN